MKRPMFRNFPSWYSRYTWYPVWLVWCSSYMLCGWPGVPPTCCAVGLVFLLYVVWLAWRSSYMLSCWPGVPPTCCVVGLVFLLHTCCEDGQVSPNMFCGWSGVPPTCCVDGLVFLLNVWYAGHGSVPAEWVTDAAAAGGVHLQGRRGRGVPGTDNNS